MRKFKTIDLWTQGILIGLCTPGAIAVGDFRFIIAYIIVGSVQVLSALIHLVLNGNYVALTTRKYYGLIVVTLLALLSITFNSDFGIIYGLFMLIVSPFLAVWYIRICYRELQLLETSPDQNTSSTDFHET